MMCVIFSLKALKKVHIFNLFISSTVIYFSITFWLFLQELIDSSFSLSRSVPWSCADGLCRGGYSSLVTFKFSSTVVGLCFPIGVSRGHSYFPVKSSN